MATLNELKYWALMGMTGASPPVTLNELEVMWLEGDGYAGTLDEMYMQMFEAEGIGSGSFNERFYEWLGQQGCTNDTLNEREMCFWGGGGILPSFGDPFIVRTTATASSFQFYMYNIGLPVSGQIDWGDGEITDIDSWDDPDITHVYAVAGQYDIKATGNFPSINLAGGASNNVILGIEQLGETNCRSFEGLLSNAKNATYCNTFPTPDVSRLVNASHMTKGCTNDMDFTLWNWPTDRAFSLQAMMRLVEANSVILTGCDLRWCTNFATFMGSNSGNTTIFDNTGMLTRDATTYSNMFYLCSGITSIDLLGFDMAVAENINGMFVDCSGLTEIVFADHVWGNSLIVMRQFAKNCTSLTKLDFGSGFTTPYLEDMFESFRGLTSLVDWSALAQIDTSNVTSVGSCLRGLGVTPRDIPIDQWDIGSCTDLNYFLDGSELTTVAYDAALIAWDSLPSVQPQTNSVHMGASKYTGGGAAEAARTSLIAKFGQSIIDGGVA